MQADHRKPVNLKHHVSETIFLEAIVYDWLHLASNYALVF